MKMNILGNIYAVNYLDEPTPYMKDGDFGAMVDYNKKTISVINKFHGHIEKFEGESKKTKEYMREDLLHEIAHAFLVESGQDDINNERTVEIMSKFCKFVEFLNLESL